MSVKAMAWAFEQDCSGNDKVVLLALADHCGKGDDEFVCYPGQKLIAVRARVDERTVRRCLGRLEELGLVQRDPRHRENGSRTSDLYTLPIPPGQFVQAPPGTGAQAPRTQVSAPEPSVEPSEESPSRDDAPLSFFLADMIERNGSKRPRVTRTWAVEEDRLLRLDRRDYAEVYAVMNWAQADSFWRSNILSMPKFREKYDQLRLRMENETPVAVDDGFG